MARSTLALLASASCLALHAGGPGAGPAHAQEAAQLPVPAAQTLDPITVTATTNPLRAFEYPGQVSVIGRDEIEILNPSTVDDVLRFTPGVTFSGGPRRSGEVPSIRGFDGPDVLVLFDGVRQNFNAGHDGRLFIDPSLLRSVEVVRGPASALYGSGGLGGVIEMRTVEAGDFLDHGETAGVRFGTGLGSADSEHFYSAAAFARAAGLDMVGAFTHRRADEIELGDGEELAHAHDRIGSGLLKGVYTGLENQRFELSYLAFRNEPREPNNPQGTGSAGIADKDVENDTLRFGYRFTDPDRRWLDLGLTTFYARNEVKEEMLDNAGLRPQGTRLSREVDTIGLRVDNRSWLGLGDASSLLLTYGGEVFGDEQNGWDSAAPDRDREGVPDADALTGAAFVQGELLVDEPFGTPGSWLIVPGLRYDHFRNSAGQADDTEDGAASPKLGVSYLPTDWLMLFASYATAFRAPTFDELYADGLHFNIGPIVNEFVANPDLRPQKTHNYEAGAGIQFEDVLSPGDEISLKGSYFHIKGDDFIDLVVDQPAITGACFAPAPFGIDCDGTTRAENVADATLHGVEIEGGYDTERWLLKLAYSYLDGEDDDTGDALGVVQPHRFATQVGYKLPEIDSIVGWRGIFASRLDRATAENERDAYVTHDLFAAWEPKDGLLDGFRLDLGITNLTDKTYSRVFTGASEEGRSFHAAVSYTLTW